LQNLASGVLAVLAAILLALAQNGAQARTGYAFSQQELDQMLAPIALYPDPLLSQILMAATYPIEVAEAARWSRDRPGLSGDDAVRAGAGENWDPSVKSLVAFPQVLERMEQNPQWTQALGDAFLDQQAQVMDTVQALRRRADAAGNLRSDDQVRVLDTGSGLLLEPVNPRFVYVPYYDPLVVYGSWWWPAYPPVYWRPWPGYYARPGYVSGLYWGPAIGISAGFFFGTFDWPRRQVRVVQVSNYYYRHGVAANRGVIANRVPGTWRHEPEHRRGLVYRGIETQRRFDAKNAPRDQGNRASPADLPRADRRLELRPSPPPEVRPDGRRSGIRPADETRAMVQIAPPAQPAPAMPSAPTAPRFDHRRELRDSVHSAPAAPVIQPAPAIQPAPMWQPVPAAQPAPRFDHRREMRDTVQPVPAVQIIQAAPVMRSTPVMQPAPPRQPAPSTQAAPPWHGNRQAAHPEPGARHMAPHAGGSTAGASPVQAATRHDTGAAEPAGRTRAAR
jgi:hypothetical protein